ncbi:hypothetical protein HLH34_10920 [Gluconacetobacter azotocaptans]|uniref:Uncharacterized protein n=1 Tax=Gluconacetobacter azotocaptans TaxID=142834 RepID=A0A7W4PE58_9PROT|nr:hypothetical protein [Gluconacetobacter azotocaptans]MBB2190468.1 hypothetical protein [Gluconacetobacter azotocaptans]MBM9400495.1 hypothetical protein [Gluconacetobacter azotocaptans]GBQ28835.1 hypothetical protein AA13594_1149 [Gluconacetobacter azotocaptans DSM 13594]
MLFSVFNDFRRRAARPVVDAVTRCVERLFSELEITSQDLLDVLACQDGIETLNRR